MTPPPEKISSIRPPEPLKKPAQEARERAGEQVDPDKPFKTPAQMAREGAGEIDPGASVIEKNGTPEQNTNHASESNESSTESEPKDTPATLVKDGHNSPAVATKSVTMGVVNVGIKGQSTEGGRKLHQKEIAEKTKKQGWVRNFMTRLWRGSMNKEAYERDAARRAKELILETGNIHVLEGGSKEDSDATMAVVTERLLEEGVQYAGETRSILSESTPENQAYIRGIKEIVAAYARGEIDEDAFIEAKDLLLKETFPKSEELTKEGSLFADNILAGAKQVKLRFEHDEALQDLLDSLQFVGAETDVGMNTETQLSRTEEVYDKILAKNWGPLNASTVAFGVTTVLALSRRGITSVSSRGAKMLVPIGGALVIGGLAAKRESIRLRKERTSIARAEAAGFDADTEVDPDAKPWQQHLQRKAIEKRARLEATTYATAGALEAAEYLNGMFEEDSEKLTVTTPEEFAELMYRVAKLELMLEKGDEEDIDLLHYTSVVDKEAEKWALYKAISRISGALASASEEFYPEQTVDTVRAVYKEAAEQASTEVLSDIDIKDRLYKRYSREESLKAGAKAAAISGILAFLAQEGMAIVNGTDHFPGAGGRKLVGLVGEKQHSGNEVLTSAEALSAHGVGHPTTIEVSDTLGLKLPNGAYMESGAGGSGSISIFDSHGELLETVNAPGGRLDPSEITRLTHEGFLSSKTVPASEFTGSWAKPVEVSDGLDVRLPQGYSLDHVNGGYSISGPNGSSVGEFTVGPNGHITSSGVANLETNGFNVSEITGLESTNVTVNGQSAGEFINSYQGPTRHISLEGWYGNGTPKADLNEIVPQITINNKGDVLVEISGMKPDGSFTGSQSVNPLAAVDAGKVELMMSVDPDNPSKVISVAFENVDGKYQAIIPANDDASQLFGVEGGRGAYGFGGNWLAVGQVTGENDAGITEVMSISSIRGPNVLNDLTNHIAGTQEASVVSLAPSGPTTWEVDLSSLEGSLEAPPEEYLPLSPIFGDFTRTSIGELRYRTKQKVKPQPQPLVPEPTPALPWRPPFGYLPAPRQEEENQEDSDDIPPVVTNPVQQSGLNFTEGTFNSSITAGPAENPEFTSEQLSGDTFVNVYAGYGGSPVEIAQTRQEFLPDIQTNPTAELQAGEELSGYRQHIASTGVHGQNYLESVDAVIEATPELASLPSATKAIVTIPVDIHGSAGSVYKALSLFAAQKSDDALAATTIMVYGYYPGIITEDPNNTELSDYMADIERFKINHPNVRIASVQKRVSDTIANDPLRIPGYIGRQMSDTAMLSVEKAISEGTIPPEQDVLMIRNDVDQIGMSLDYLRRMIDEADKHPETDIFMGATLWNTGEQIASPGLGVVTNFKEAMDLLSSRRPTDFERPTSGINTAVRMSTFAAVGGLGFGEYMGPGSDDLEIGRRVRVARAGNDNIVRHVTDARIDTRGRAVVEAYRKNRSITVAMPIEVGKSPDPSGTATKKDAKDNLSSPELFAPTLARIEHNISEMATEWYQDPGLVESGLMYIFHDLPSGRDAYEVVWRNGICTVRFTDAGKEELRNSLRRNSRRQFDSYGRRRLRGQYNYVARGAKIRPRTAPRMAGPYSSLV